MSLLIHGMQKKRACFFVVVCILLCECLHSGVGNCKYHRTTLHLLSTCCASLHTAWKDGVINRSVGLEHVVFLLWRSGGRLHCNCLARLLLCCSIWRVSDPLHFELLAKALSFKISYSLGSPTDQREMTVNSATCTGCHCRDSVTHCFHP